MVTIKNYVRPETAAEAYELNQKRNNRIIGGMLFLKLESGSVDTAIDLSGLGLSGIEETAESFIIGAMTPLRALEQHEGLNVYSNGAVRTALQDIVGVQFRNLATVGGSLFGRFGFSDVLTLFLPMDASVELYQGGIIPLEQFVQMKRDKDLLLRLIVKKTPGAFVYEALRLERTDLPVLNCAFSYAGGEFRAVYGARPGRAMLLRDPENILTEQLAAGHGLTEAAIKAFAVYAKNHVPTGSNLRGSAAYRTQLVQVLTERNLEKLGGLL